jgi:hypothetical protein
MGEGEGRGVREWMRGEDKRRYEEAIFDWTTKKREKKTLRKDAVHINTDWKKCYPVVKRYTARKDR